MNSGEFFQIEDLIHWNLSVKRIINGEGILLSIDDPTDPFLLDEDVQHRKSNTIILIIASEVGERTAPLASELETGFALTSANRLVFSVLFSAGDRICRGGVGKPSPPGDLMNTIIAGCVYVIPKEI
jgi:hypothetical protein